MAAKKQFFITKDRNNFDVAIPVTKKTLKRSQGCLIVVAATEQEALVKAHVFRSAEQSAAKQTATAQIPAKTVSRKAKKVPAKAVFAKQLGGTWFEEHGLFAYKHLGRAIVAVEDRYFNLVALKDFDDMDAVDEWFAGTVCQEAGHIQRKINEIVASV